MNAASGDFRGPQNHGFADLDPELAEKKRLNFIKPTDSEYVKLAKQGGSKDLLSIESQKKSDEAVNYAKSEWFEHHAMESDEQEKILASCQWKAPDYMTHDNKKAEGQCQGNSQADGPRAQLTAHEQMLINQAKNNNRNVPYQSDDLSFWERKNEPELRSRRRK